MIWLVRHASTAWTGVRWCGSSDPSLDQAGRRAAVTAARRLGRVEPRPALIVTSPARRARQTAAAIARQLGLACDVDDSLREVDFGSAEGLRWSEIESRWPTLALDILAGQRFVDWPDGESAAAAKERIERLAVRLRELPRFTVVVTHGGVIRALIAPHDSRPVAPAEVTGLRWRRGGWVPDQASTTTLARIHG